MNTDFFDKEQIEQEQDKIETETMAAASPNSLVIGDTVDEARKDYLAAPFCMNRNEHENISLSTGALDLNYVDFTIPGKNGFDLVVARNYNLASAGTSYPCLKKATGYQYGRWVYQWDIETGDIDTEFLHFMYYDKSTQLKAELKDYGYAENVIYDDWCQYIWGKQESIKKATTFKRKNDHFTNLYGLGQGWRFCFPSLELFQPSDKAVQELYYMHLEDGRSLTVIKDDNDVVKFEGYDLNDITIDSNKNITYKDGRKAVFSKYQNAEGFDEYVLSYMEDRFGNRITLHYSSKHELTHIVDTFGQTFRLERSATSDPKLDSMRWIRDETGEVLYKYLVEKGTAGSPTYDSYTKLVSATAIVNASSGQEVTTQYAYSTQAGGAQLLHSDSGDERIQYEYIAVDKITYPTGAQTVYQYGQRTTAKGGCMKGSEYYPVVTSRKDIPDPANPDFVQNEETYEYTNQYTDSRGQKKYYTLSLTAEQQEYTGWMGKGASFFKEVTIYSKAYIIGERYLHNVKRVHTFSNDRGLLSEEKVYDNNILVLRRTYGYDRIRTQPITETLETYAPNGIDKSVQTTKFKYDNKNNLLEQTTECTNDPDCNQRVAMQYDAKYNMLIKKEVLKEIVNGVKRYITEQYDLDSDKKIVVEKRILDNGILKERTGYERYGAENANLKFCLKSEKQYYAEGSALAATEDCHVTEYQYTQDNLHMPTTVRFLGIVDAAGNPVNSTDPADQLGIIKNTMVYDAFGRTISQTNGNYHTTHYEYDGLGRVTMETYPGDIPSCKRIIYDDRNNCVTVIDEAGYKTRFDYTPLGAISKEVLVAEDGSEIWVTSYEYDIFGRTSTMYTYEEDKTVKTKTTYTYNWENQVTAQTTVDKVGKVLAKTTTAYENAVEQKFSCVKTVVEGGENAANITTESYTDQFGQVRKEVVHVSSDQKATVLHTYDCAGNKISQTDALGNRTTWDYDYAGRAVKQTNALGQISQTLYDALGNKREVKNPLGDKTLFKFDAMGRLLKEESDFSGASRSCVLYFYDNANNLILQKNLCSAPGSAPKWKQFAQRFDKQGRVLETIHYEDFHDDSQPVISNTTRFEYDALGNKTAIFTGITSNPSEMPQVTRYSYDRFGNVCTMIDARSSTLENTDPNYAEEIFTYNALGRMISKQDRNGAVTQYKYDPLGRIVCVRTEDEMTTMRYSLTGKPVLTVNDTLTITNHYNESGLLDKQTETGGVTKEYTYNLNGNRTTFNLYKNGSQIEQTYQYDALGRLKSVKSNNAEIAVYTYDANGNRITQAYPQNNTVTTYTYNQANMVTRLENKVDGAVKSSYAYTYFLDGNQKTKTNEKGDVTEYEYDRLGRLVKESVTERDEKTGGTVITSYTYDRFGNRISMKVENGGNKNTESKTVYSYHPNNWLLKEEKTSQNGEKVETTYYRYDANGNQLYRQYERMEQKSGAKGKLKIVKPTDEEDIVILEIRKYNKSNQLTEVYRDGKRSYYNYRPDGMRHSKTANGVTKIHFWDGENIVAEAIGNNVVARYLRSGTLIAWMQDSNINYYLHNAHGDVAQIVQNGKVLYSYDYDAFGNEKSPNAKYDGNPFRYCGEYYDREIENVYLRARYYDPSTGRFTAEDPIKDGANWYSYCAGNPVAFVDLTGCKENPSSLCTRGDWAFWGYDGNQNETRPGNEKIQQYEQGFGRDISKEGVTFGDLQKDVDIHIVDRVARILFHENAYNTTAMEGQVWCMMNQLVQSREANATYLYGGLNLNDLLTTDIYPKFEIYAEGADNLRFATDPAAYSKEIGLEDNWEYALELAKMLVSVACNPYLDPEGMEYFLELYIGNPWEGTQWEDELHKFVGWRVDGNGPYFWYYNENGSTVKRYYSMYGELEVK